MTTLVEAREQIYQRFANNFTTVPLTFEGEDFDPPETAWVRLVVRHTAGGQDTLGPVGARRFIRRGIIRVTIYTPTNQGLRQGDALGQEVLNLFEAIRFDGIRPNDGLVRESPIQDEWIVHVADILFDYEETK